MKLPLRSTPDHAISFPLRPRTRQLHQRPRYMAKRPLLTIQIPTLIDRMGKDERAHEVSCFSPFTPESSQSEFAPSTARETPGDENQPDPAGVGDGRSMANVMEDEDDGGNQQAMPRFGSRWSRLFQHGCLHPLFHQAQRTPPRRKRFSTISTSDFAAIDFDPRHPANGLSNPRRTSNPFDYLSSHCLAKSGGPISHDKTPTQLDIRPAVPIHSPVELLDSLNTPKNLCAPWRSTTC